MEYFNRYQNFLINGQQTVVPFVSIPEKSTDKRYIFRQGMSRMDKISMEFYNSPYFGWLILSANPRFGGIEENIPDQTIISIPFPLVSSLQDYKAAIDNHFFYYGR
jgi:hypothetical protein